MEVELVTDETSDDENYGFDDTSEDYLNIEGERCGICMDVVIDRGVLDCCQHWFCFACIDNWATITSLCPLCQNEFQLITCVPVYDTVGGNKTDDDTNLRDDDWFIEGKSNTLSFPSYYIDENAVVCLDGDGCKIRSGSVAIEDDSDIDTSIACDSCDKWYHAFCVGFDPEGSSDSSWLCPRCTLDKGPNASFSGSVSVSVADDGETAVVISLLDGNQESQKSSQSAVGCSKDMGNTLLPCSISSLPNLEALPGDRESVEPNSCQQGIELTLSRDNRCSSSHAILPAELNTNADGGVEIAPRQLNKKMIDSGLDLDLGISMGFDTSVHMKDNDIAEDKVPGSSKPNHRSEDLIPVVSAEKMAPNEILENMMPDDKLTISGITGAKRKHRDSRNADDGGREANIEARISRKKNKAEKNSQPISLTNQTAASVPDDSSSIFRLNRSRKKENSTSDIMYIVQGTDRKYLKQPGHKTPSDITPNERESAAGLRLKKIMRRPGDDKDSSVLVQELRKKIRAAVRNKSSEELGQNLFDPKLLDAFRAALAGSGAENRKPTLDVRVKRSLLQKGKIRESLTKKIYGAGGKRKRAWTRECEVEFWKHRCLKTSKPEKIRTLKSVLDVLRDNNSDHAKKMPGNEEETQGSILSRLYLADTSVFPRKNDIKPVSNLDDVATPEQNRESGLTEKVSIPLPINKNSPQQNSLFQLKVPILDGKETKKSVKGVKSESASKGAPTPAVGKKVPSEKDLKASKSDTVKGDKRQWALEVLARRTAASGKNMQEKEEDSVILKGNYTLLAQLPKEMRPVLAPSRHDKISAPVRQTQLYRLAEQFLKKANVSVVCRTAETELAVADAVNIEKQVADRSNSKLVYLNLCSQELLRRSDDMNSARPKEANNPCTTSDEAIKETNNNNNNYYNSSLDLEVEEALKRAGLMSDSPPTSPSHPADNIINNSSDNNKDGSLKISDDEGPENVIEVDSHSELDIYGDFEYNLEDDDFIGAGALNNPCKPQPEPPKLKMLFSSLKPEKPDGIVGPPDHEEALTNSTGQLESENRTGTGGSIVDSGKDEGLIRNPVVDNDEDLSMAECEELYGPDKEPLIEKYPVIISVKPFEQMVNNELPGENGDNQTVTKSGQPSEDCMDNLEAGADGSKLSPSDLKKKENVVEKEKSAKSDTKRSEQIMKKVEAYVKEHIRPLCKSGVITVEQYRWAVGKTTEKVMKYHSKEKNANFLIKEGEKVKKLAEQYVEASQQKTIT